MNMFTVKLPPRRRRPNESSKRLDFNLDTAVDDLEMGLKGNFLAVIDMPGAWENRARVKFDSENAASFPLYRGCEYEMEFDKFYLSWDSMSGYALSNRVLWNAKLKLFVGWNTKAKFPVIGPRTSNVQLDTWQLTAAMGFVTLIRSYGDRAPNDEYKPPRIPSVASYTFHNKGPSTVEVSCILTSTFLNRGDSLDIVMDPMDVPIEVRTTGYAELDFCRIY